VAANVGVSVDQLVFEKLFLVVYLLVWEDDVSSESLGH
jgi:hypothetical protein